MNRKITKDMAKKASDMMMEKAYGRKIRKVTHEINDVIETLVRKEVPAPVLACVAEYSDYFNLTSYVGITTIRETKCGLISANRIFGCISFKVPSICSYLKVDCKDYDDLLKLETKRKALQKKKEEFGQQVSDALLALRTEKNVEKELPEAMKYIVFPEVKALPMPVFTGLRDIIAMIKDE